jgi:hypothetical protein
VTVATTAPALFIPDYPKMSPPHAVNFRLVILLMVLLALALIAGQVSQHVARNRSLATVMQAFILLGVGIAMAACGGGGNTTATPQTGTPSGTYSITVSGTFSSGSTTLTHNTKLTLVVQ